MAYENCPRDMTGLGLSLKPPQWLRDLASSVRVTVKPTTLPLPGGVGTVTVGNPAQRIAQQIEQNVPGGFGTVAAVGIGAVLLMLLMGRRRG